MPTDSLLSTLRSLELDLHDSRVRRSRERLATLLHPRFREFGRSGAEYTQAELSDLRVQPIQGACARIRSLRTGTVCGFGHFQVS
jgi:hypothetical protein